MGMLKEFRDFAFKSNLLDVGIGFVIGAATTAFIGAFTANLVTPWLGLAGGANFGNLFMVLKGGKTAGATYATPAAATADGAVVLTYGVFLDEFVKFLLLMIVMFLIVRTVNRFKKAEEAAPAEPPRTEVLLEEIRDALKSR